MDPDLAEFDLDGGSGPGLAMSGPDAGLSAPNPAGFGSGSGRIVPNLAGFDIALRPAAKDEKKPPRIKQLSVYRGSAEERILYARNAERIAGLIQDQTFPFEIEIPGEGS